MASVPPLDGKRRIVPPDGDPYWQLVIEEAARLKSDGCTFVPDFYGGACLEHDIHYRTHKWLDGEPITKAEADTRFRLVMQAWSKLGKYDPMSWWRWLAVKLCAHKAWNKHVMSDLT